MKTHTVSLRIGNPVPLTELASHCELELNALKKLLCDEIRHHFYAFGTTPYFVEFSREFNDYVLRAGPVIGRIVCGRLVIEISPKFQHLEIGKCLQLAHYSQALQLVNHSSQISPDLVSDLDPISGVDYFAQAFLNAVQDCVNSGLIQRSSEVVEPDRDFAGKLEVSRHVELGANPLEPIVRKKKRSHDGIFNSVLKSALMVCKETCGSPGIRGLSNSLLLQFQDCEDLRDLDEALNTRFRSSVRRVDYEHALALAEIILTGFDPNSDSETGFTPNFTINLDVLFEVFCAFEISNRISEEHFSVSLQETTSHNITPKLDAKDICPDVVVKPYNEGHRTVVLDTKNKFSLSSSDTSYISNSDVFQIVYYSIRYGSNVGVLLYPGDKDSRTQYPIPGSEGSTAYERKRKNAVEKMHSSGKDIFVIQTPAEFYLVTWRIDLSGTLHDTKKSVAELCQFVTDVSAEEILN